MSAIVAVLSYLTLSGGGVASMADSDPVPVPGVQGWAMSSLSKSDAKSETAVEVSPPVDDKAWALKRDWTDTNFQEGAEENHARLQAFEDILVSRMRSSVARASQASQAYSEALLDTDALDCAPDTSEGGNVLTRVLEPTMALQSYSGDAESLRFAVLNDPEVLGSALDIVGAYLKNYEVDKAAAVVETVLPVVRQRGGLWLLKALNHLATVRMKQARPAEALEILKEVEAYVGLNQQEEKERDEAWEFWEKTYRNFAWCLSSLDRDEEALQYLQKVVDVKERVGETVSWFDLWDLGRMKATSALKRNEVEIIQAAASIVTKSLWLHKEAEPTDLVMRAKIWHTVGECTLLVHAFFCQLP